MFFFFSFFFSDWWHKCIFSSEQKRKSKNIRKFNNNIFCISIRLIKHSSQIILSFRYIFNFSKDMRMMKEEEIENEGERKKRSSLLYFFINIFTLSHFICRYLTTNSDSAMCVCVCIRGLSGHQKLYSTWLRSRCL